MEDRKSFDAYKNTKSDVEATKQAVQSKTEPTKTSDYTKDKNLYTYKRDNSGNAFVILRLLPSINSLPPTFIRHQHFCEGNGWYTEYCPTTVGKECPICKEYNEPMWKKAEKSDPDTMKTLKGIVGGRSRSKQYFSNIYVVKDSNQPECTGKVMIWQYGIKVYEKIMAALEPSPQLIDAGKHPIDVFNMYTGANFILKIKAVSGRANYDDCEFMQAGPLFDNDESMKVVYDQIFDLTKYTPDVVNTKSYQELQAKAYEVLGKPTIVGTSTTPVTTAPAMTGQPDPASQQTLGEKVQEQNTPVTTTPETVQPEQTNTNVDTKVETKVEGEPVASDDIDDYFSNM